MVPGGLASGNRGNALDHRPIHVRSSDFHPHVRQLRPRGVERSLGTVHSAGHTEENPF